MAASQRGWYQSSFPQKFRKNVIMICVILYLPMICETKSAKDDEVLMDINGAERGFSGREVVMCWKQGSAR